MYLTRRDKPLERKQLSLHVVFFISKISMPLSNIQSNSVLSKYAFSPYGLNINYKQNLHYPTPMFTGAFDNMNANTYTEIHSVLDMCQP